MHIVDVWLNTTTCLKCKTSFMIGFYESQFLGHILNIRIPNIIFYYPPQMQGEKGQGAKIRKDKKKNTQTGLLMGQNTNIFSQLSATYLQSKPSTTQEQLSFVKQTQIIEYHDPKINRLISLLRKKADVTKSKAAIELRDQIMRMNEDNMSEFIQTFSHLFMEVVINQQSKQTVDEFVTMMNYVLANFKKVAIKQIATIFAPLLVINRSYNTSQHKIYSMLFNGTDEQIQQKAIILLLNKNVTKKFLLFCRVIIECEDANKISQQNYQRNCSYLLKVVKQLIRSYNGIGEKKQQLAQQFSNFIRQIDEIVSSKFAQDYLKAGGRAKSSFLQFYQVLVSQAVKHPEWNIQWQPYAKIICQNYLDKDPLVQQSLWKYCNKQFIQSTLEIEKMETGKEEEGEVQKQKYRIFNKYLPKPQQKLLTAIKLGVCGQNLYKELPSYCFVFPYTTILPTENHKTIVNKITFMRKLMQTLLELEDENQARIQCYYQLVIHLFKQLRKFTDDKHEMQEKKLQEIKSLCLKAEKQFINNLQDRYYKNPPQSRNSFSYNIPTYFCRILVETQPTFDYLFDKKETFSLYSPLAASNSKYCLQLFDQIFQNCRTDVNLVVQYLENFPSRSVALDMSEKNENVEQASKTFLLSLESRNLQNWFNPEWDSRKKLICFDPRISWAELSKFLQQEQNTEMLKPNSKNVSHQAYLRPEHDEIRFNFFLECLQSEQQVNLVTCQVSLIKDILFQRNQNRANWINRILNIHSENVAKLQKKQWVVSQSSVLRLRVVCDLIFEGLKRIDTNKPITQQIDKKKLNEFTDNYCLFALTLYNYKLEADSEELLKLIPRVLVFDFISTSILKSVIDTVKFAYDAYARNLSITLGQVQEKQRKNRLARLLNFVRKLLWYGMDKKKQQGYIEVFKNLLSYQDWKYAELRADLWMLIEVALETLDSKLIRKITRNILLQFNNNAHFLALLMCCHLILPLQRHPSTKKLVLQLQKQVFKQIKQNFTHDQNCQILNVVIAEAIQNESFLLINGAKDLLRNLMKNYQQMSKQNLQQYELQGLQKPFESLVQSQPNRFNKNCLLLRSLCVELPLPDLPNISKIYKEVEKVAETQKDSLRKVGYLTILSSFWQVGVGIQKLTPEASQQTITQFTVCMKELVSQQSQINFARYYGLTFLNSLLQFKSKQLLKDCWEFVLNQIILPKVQQGISLHSEIQTARYSLISKIFNFCPNKLQNELVTTIPNEILIEVKFYKEVLDLIEDDQNEEQQADLSTRGYENILNIFIQSAEVLIRIAGCLAKQVKPKQEVMLELLQCPFAGIKKTSFMMLKQMYQLKLVDRTPPPVFLTYLKMNPQILKSQLDPMTANVISGYLYSWQSIIERREATEVTSQEEENSLSLEDYLQNQQLLELFLRNIFEIIENQLEYTQNESQLQITVEELVKVDAIIVIDDDFNLHQKVFRLIARTLFMFVENFPYFLRDFVDRNKKFRPVCDRLLRNVISDAIFQQEVARIEVREHEWKSAGNFEIYVTPKNKQIYAQYTHDVIRIGLRLVMKSNYPITPLSIQFGEGLKIEEGSRWALMLQSQLHNRNNTIIKGILLWKDNIDKKLGGVEECAICFDIVNSSGQLPRKGCKTCKKKFHSVCIMKWFNKSNKSQCPLCKSQFL